MNIIVAVDNQWEIGKDGDLLQHISADMKYFRNKTLDNVVVMGRKTLESFPGGKPLSGRMNVVLTTNKSYKAEGVVLCHDITELSGILKEYSDRDVYVIGGGSVYEQLLPFCKRAYVTKIYNVYPADTTFPNLDEHQGWKLVENGEIQEEDGIKFSFDVYEKIT